MYSDNEPKICTVTRDDLLAIIAAKEESLRDVSSRLERLLPPAPANATAHFSDPVAESLTRTRARLDGLAFLRKHIGAGPFDLTITQLGSLRDQLAPVDPAAILAAVTVATSGLIAGAGPANMKMLATAESPSSTLGLW